ncbi:hypothetical protein HGM15179_016363 [Zosterops borbonicus]|uniref:Uncharacterized protein n=1 Tax=Zosterops borbonicus TaxID=364589 RepID=A0A8K1G2Y9_9PASS|nr:hypothetical protein HGM15179_016363 [Zosterops borbonicus]
MDGGKERLDPVHSSSHNPKIPQNKPNSRTSAPDGSFKVKGKLRNRLGVSAMKGGDFMTHPGDSKTSNYPPNRHCSIMGPPAVTSGELQEPLGSCSPFED